MTGKLPHIAVQYGRGMATSHCGPTSVWPSGHEARHICTHFRKSTATGHVACVKVQDPISAAGWCALFHASKESK